jgi:hypothetical protein
MEGVRCDYWRDGETGTAYLYPTDNVPACIPAAFRPKHGRKVEDGPYAPLLALPPGASHTFQAPEVVVGDPARMYRWVQRVRAAVQRIGDARGKAFLTRQQGPRLVVRCLFDEEGPAPRGRPRTRDYLEVWDLQPGQRVLVPVGDAEAARVRVSAYRIAEQRGVRMSCQVERGAGVWVRHLGHAAPDGVPAEAAHLFG